MDLNLEKYNPRDATMRSLLAVAHIFGIKDPSKEQQEELSEVADALETRVQDAIDEAVKNFQPNVEEDLPSQEVDEKSVFFLYEEKFPDEIHQVVVDGIIFGKFCNEPVEFDHAEGRSTTCIKEWGHLSTAHQDHEGNERL